jgi:sulfide:quinone oxidoreductase
LYDGYGACPLAVERGKVVLAKFGWGGKLLPTFPRWLIDGTKPSSLAWLVKAKLLPWYYWHVMLPGRVAFDPLVKPVVKPAEQSSTESGGEARQAAQR